MKPFSPHVAQCAGAFFMFLVACGDSDPQSDVCSTAAAALVENCDPNSRDDVNAVSTSLRNACGIEFSANELNSQGDLERLCLDALQDTEVSQADAASFRAVLDTKVGCQSVANNIGLACRDFL